MTAQSAAGIQAHLRAKHGWREVEFRQQADVGDDARAWAELHAGEHRAGVEQGLMAHRGSDS